MKKLFVFLAISLSIISAQAHTYKVDVKELEIKRKIEGGGIGLVHSAKLGTEYKAAQEAKKICTEFDGLIKKDSLVVDEATCGEVFDFQGFKGRYCSTNVSAICLIVIQ